MNIHQVIQDVKQIRQRLVNSGYFFGYSPGARFLGGFIALLGASLLSLLPPTASPWSHFSGWGVVFVLAVAANYTTLFRKLHFSRRQLSAEAVIEPLLPIITGGVLTTALALQGEFGFLFGIWMTLFGLANVAAKKSFSREVALVGYYYLASGWLFLLIEPLQTFTNPWTMGLVFFVGESAGAYAFHRHNQNNEEA